MQIPILIIISILISACTTSGMQGPKNILNKHQYALTAVYNTPVSCAAARKTDCGYTLYACVGGVIILCADDVAIVDARDLSRQLE